MPIWHSIVTAGSILGWWHLCDFLCPWNSPGNNTGASRHSLLQDIFPTQGSNPHVWRLLHWQVDSLPLSRLWSPHIFVYLFFNGGRLVYNIVLVSAIHQHGSAVGVRVSPLSWSRLPPSTPSPPRLSQSPRVSSLSHTANSHRLFSTLYSNVCFQAPLLPSHPLLPLLRPQLCSLWWGLHCSPASRFVNTRQMLTFILLSRPFLLLFASSTYISMEGFSQIIRTGLLFLNFGTIQ